MIYPFLYIKNDEAFNPTTEKDFYVVIYIFIRFHYNR